MSENPAKLLLALGLLAALAGPGRADDGESPGGAPHRVHALTGARVVTRPGVVLPEATVVLRDGVVEAVGADVAAPPDARVWDMRGLTIYPGLIEPYLRLEGGGGAGGDDEAGTDDPAAAGPAGGARHENAKVRADRSIAAELDLSDDALAGLRKAGFTAAHLVPGEGVFRGQSALVALRDGPARRQVVRPDVAQVVAFERGGWGAGAYPGSLMGAMALVRQTLLDARFHAAAWRVYGANPLGRERPAYDLALAALGPALRRTQPVCVEAEDAQMLLRAARLLAGEDLAAWVVTGGCDEYRWLEPIREAGLPLVVSLNFPPAPEWEGEEERVGVETAALRHWYLAPENAARLEQVGLRFAFTSQGLAERGDFRARVRAALDRGLSPEAALAAFTTAPAAFLRAPQLGVVAPGALANLTVTAGDLFGPGGEVVEVWVDGARYPSDPAPPAPKDLAGTWLLALDGAAEIAVELSLEEDRLLAALAPPGDDAGDDAGDTGDTGADADDDDARALPAPERWRDRLELTLPPEAAGTLAPAVVTLRTGSGVLRGAYAAGEQRGDALARRRPPQADAPDEEEAEPLAVLAWPSWPPLPEEAPPAVLFRGGALWTLGPEGTFTGDLLVRDGAIAAVGADLDAPADALVVDAAGKHLTPGLVDCHSHSFVAGGVNEGTNNCTAEVRIDDVLNAETVRIYQQLAGGLTVANVLHGSANAIGGQSAVIKLRWGEPADGLRFARATPGIKWALGENPKRSNWGHGLAPRYPTTRMGVIESIRERLAAARDYASEWAAWRREASPDRIPPRRDLQLEALVEVLEGERLVHCHSYRQDEILALIRLAEEFGFRIGTFQHVLEGYKVADEIAAHGAGASTFSDWWAYKFEVYDAIAYNGALMHERGVLVSFNSDSSELARRLNQEAAKAVRYGGVAPADALAFVTRSPARQLGVDDRVGSLEVGKSADVVVWSGDPLEVTTVCEQTWLDGRRYFELERDREAYATASAEREALLEAARRARFAEPSGSWDWSPTFGRPARGARAAACCAGHDERSGR